MTIPQSELAAMRAREQAATPGPWLHDTMPDGSPSLIVYADHGVQPHVADMRKTFNESPSDSDFIAHARTDLPRALDEIDALSVLMSDEREVSETLHEQNDALTAENIGLREANAEALAKVKDIKGVFNRWYDGILEGDTAMRDMEELSISARMHLEAASVPAVKGGTE